MAAEGELTSWTVEEIPDSDRLFMRAHRMFFKDGKLAPGVFRDQGDGISVDWERYSSPDETQRRARKPEDNAVVEMKAGDIRPIPLTVEHHPVEDNRAHSEVLGRKDPQARIMLRRASRIVIPLQDS